MSDLKLKRGLISITFAALILPSLALAQSQITTTQVDQPNRVAVAYIPPKNPDFQELYRLLSGRLALEKIQTMVQVRLEGFASDHGLPQERFYNLLCLAYGADPVMFDDLPRVGYLPLTRASRCKREYKKLADAFHKEISPHIDQEMAKMVLQTNWLPGPVIRREPQK